MDTRNEIAGATLACTEAFEACLVLKELMKNEWAENRLADFRLWVSGIGARAKGKASLDSRLALKPEARGVITNVLLLLSTLVEECRKLAISNDSIEKDNSGTHESQRGRSETLLPEESHPRAFSPWSDESDSQDEDSALSSDDDPLEEKKKRVETFLRQLAQIAMVIRRSGRRSRLRKADQLFRADDYQDLDQHLTNLLLIRFGYAANNTNPSNLDEVQKRLIICNLKRRNRFIYAQKHSKVLQPLTTTQDPYSGTDEVKNEQREHRKPEESAISSEKVTPQDDKVDNPKASMGGNAFSASGVSDSLVLKETTAPSQAASSVVSMTATKVEYPLPPNTEGALSFICPCCCQTLDKNMANDGRWRKHVAEDVSPYTCVLPHCPKPEVTYPTREIWRQHLSEDHENLSYWVCLICKDGTRYENEDTFTRHVLRLHSNTVPSNRLSLLVKTWKRSAPLDIKTCPICNWPSQEEGDVEKEALIDHIAKDIHSFSLRALPWADDNGEETLEQIKDGTAKVSQWLTTHSLSYNKNEEKGPLPTKSYHSEYFLHNPYFASEAVASDKVFVPNSEVTSTGSRDEQLQEWRENESLVSFGSQPPEEEEVTKDFGKIEEKVESLADWGTKINKIFNGRSLQSGQDATLPAYLVQIGAQARSWAESLRETGLTLQRFSFDQAILNTLDQLIEGCQGDLLLLSDLLSMKREVKELSEKILNKTNQIREIVQASFQRKPTIYPTPDKASEQFDEDETTIRSIRGIMNKPIDKIMTPLEDAFTLSTTTVVDQKLVGKILSDGHLRIPIYSNNQLLNFTGLFLTQVLTSYNPEECRPVEEFALATLPETSPDTSCLDILNFFRESTSYTILISKSPGGSDGAVGVITLEDIVEEIIGEETNESEFYKYIRFLSPEPVAGFLRSLFVANKIRMRDGKVYDIQTDESGLRQDSNADDIIDFSDIAIMPRSSIKVSIPASPESEPAKEMSLENHVGDVSYFYKRAESIVGESVIPSQLVQHSLSGNFEGAKREIDSGADVNEMYQFYGTALEVASAAGQEAIVGLLLEHGASFGTTGGLWANPVLAATYFRRLRALQALLSVGADVNTLVLHKGSERSYYKECHNRVGFCYRCYPHIIEVAEEPIGLYDDGIVRNPLLVAVSKGWTDVVELLLDFGAYVEGSSNEHDTQASERQRETALHIAIKIFSGVEVAEILLSHGADINAVDENKQTPLHDASWAGKVEAIKLLLDHGADINAVDEAKRTPLHDASRVGKVEAIKLLLDHGADINAVDEYKGTPLHYASLEGEVEAIKLLIDHGADINAVSETKQTLLHDASRAGKVEAIKLLLDHGADINAVDKYKVTPLHNASRAGKMEAIKLLLDHGADINAVDEYKGTPLQYASLEGEVEAIKLLLDHGADINAVDEYKRTPLHYASWAGEVEAIKLLLDHRADINAVDENKQTPLHNASRESQAGAIKLLLDHGADVNAVDEYKRTLLHYASLEDEVEVTKLLLNHGADINAVDDNKRTPLHNASRAGKMEAIKLLLGHGADINAVNRIKETPLHEASRAGKMEAIKLLLDHGADINAVDEDKRTPLHNASRESQVGAIKLLLDHGADVNAVDKYKESPLYAASRDSEVEAMKLLLDYRADVNAVDKDTETPLHVASREDHVKAIKLLLDHGADINAVDRTKETPLHEASRAGKVEAIKLLLNHGADINAVNERGKSAITIAHEEGKTIAVDLLRESVSSSL